MAGLLEWHVGEATGLQVWSEPDRAGRSTVVFGTKDLNAESARLAEAGIDHEGAQPGGDGRILSLLDPDGNRAILAGP
jgi:hypothetical protein